MNLHFDSPYLLLLLLLLPPLAGWRFRRRRSGALSAPSLGLVTDLRPTWRVRYRWIPAALRLFALALLVVALARPQTGQAGAVVPAEGIDIVLALDVSSSMTESFRDGGTRIEVAKQVLRDFIDGRENDRLGLVAFRSQTLALSPLTLDYQALQELVEQADGSPLPDGTAIGLAVADSLNLLRESQARSRIVILLTDGGNNRFEVDPLAAARIAAALRMPVYTIGIVDETSWGADGLGPDGLSARHPDVGEADLRRIAEVAGGRYYEAESPGTLAGIYDEIAALEKSRVGEKHFSAFDERAVLLLLPGLALLGLEILLASTVFRRAP